MKKLGAFIAILLLVLVVFFLWMARLPPFDGYPEPERVAFSALDVEQDTVIVSGTAHHPMRLAVTRSGGLVGETSKWWLYPLFAPGDTGGRKIQAMVLSPEEPDPYVGLEDMEILAWVRPPAAGVTPEAMDAYREAGYSFDGAYVLLEVIPTEDGAAE